MIHCMVGIRIDNVHSQIDFGQCYASKEVSPPVKRVITETVPFHNGLYDFSDYMDGPFYDNRELSYVFEFLGDSPAKVEEEVDEFCGWLLDITNKDIYDDELDGFHWRGSCISAGASYDETGLQATVTVVFSVYPFRIANEVSTAALVIGTNNVYNPGRKARITVIPKGTVTIQVGAVRQTFIGETVADLSLDHGDNKIQVTGGSATIKWREERI